MWRIKIKLDTFQKPETIYAKEVDFSWGYQVSISGIMPDPTAQSSSIVLPSDEVYKEFEHTEQLVIPSSNVLRAEKLKDSFISKPGNLAVLRSDQ